MALDQSYIKEYVATSLGEPVIKVELDSTHYELSARRALRDFNRWRPNEEIVAYTCPSGIKVVDFPTDAIGVLWVDIITDEQSLDGINIESAMLSNPWAYISTGTPSVQVFDYELQRHWLEVLGKTFANLPDYYVEEDRLWLYAPRDAKATVVWAMPFSDVSEIPVTYEQMFLDLVLAKSRQILGQIRNKYSGVPGAGGMIQLDGADQIMRGEQAEREILADLRSLNGQIIPQMV